MNCKKCGTSLVDVERTAKYGTSTFFPKCPKCGEKLDLRKLMEMAALKGNR